MERKIKFRGKRTDTGEWVFGDLIHGVGSKHGRMYILPVTHIYPKGCNDLDGWEVIPDTAGQFTGLLDRSGKEIYEGDVLRVSAYINKGQGETYDFRDLFTVEDLKGFLRYDFMSEVKFNEGGFYLSEYSEGDTCLCILFGDMRHSFPIFECEVIGNTMHSPELLKGGSNES